MAVESPSPFAFLPDDRAALANLREHFPETIAGLEDAVRRLVAQVADSFHRTIETEAQADQVLLGLFDRITAEADPGTDDPTDHELMPGVVVSLVARSVLAEARNGFVAQVVGETEGRGEGVR